MFRLETLLRNLSLGSSDGSSRVRVDKAAALLAVLQSSRLGGADADVGGVDLGAARRRAVGVSDATAGDELRAVTGSDVLGAGVVGGQSQGGGGDYGRMVSICCCCPAAAAADGDGDVEGGVIESHQGIIRLQDKRHCCP